MLKRRRKALVAALAGASAMMCPWLSYATRGEEWPDGPVTMVVPFPAGGPTDMAARMLANQLSGLLGQAVVVQNLAGASGIVGMRHVASAPADGYTILYNTSSLVISPNLYLDPRFEPTRDFDAVSSTVAMPLVLLVHPDVPATDLHSFATYGRQLAGNLSYASAGGGNVTHLTAVLLLQALDIQAMHVPYRGSASALAGLIGANAVHAQSSRRRVGAYPWRQTARAGGDLQGAHCRLAGYTHGGRIRCCWIPGAGMVWRRGSPRYARCGDSAFESRHTSGVER